jgi:PRTRC genetic system protein A
VKVDKVPGYEEPKIEEAMNFLPAGKVPYELYEQILAFFKKVMEVNTSEVEAMIHVLYNPEQGYHLGVPPQKISKASVSYDWNYVPAGTSIVVDIHSHNTMSAFFSGTDNRDDANNISYSGVFGKLKDAEPMTVWRFNYMDKKYEAKVSDIFDAPARPEVEVPAAWLDNVKVETYQSYYGGGYSNRGNVGKWPGHSGSGPSNTTLTKNSLPQAKNVSQPVNSNGKVDKPVYYPGQDELGLEGGTFNSWSDAEIEDYFRGLGRSGVYHPYGVNEARGIILPDDVPDPNTTVTEDPEADSLGKSTGEETPSSIISTDPAYLATAVKYGTNKADAWYDIGNMMCELDGEDELLIELTADMFQLTSPEGQLKALRLLYDNMDEKSKEKLETHGFA